MATEIERRQVNPSKVADSLLNVMMDLETLQAESRELIADVALTSDDYQNEIAVLRSFHSAVDEFGLELEILLERWQEISGATRRVLNRKKKPTIVEVQEQEWNEVTQKIYGQKRGWTSRDVFKKILIEILLAVEPAQWTEYYALRQEIALRVPKDQFATYDFDEADPDSQRPWWNRMRYTLRSWAEEDWVEIRKNAVDAREREIHVTEIGRPALQSLLNEVS